MMEKKVQQAYDWAIHQTYNSVAASHARTLAEYIRSIGDIEDTRAYPKRLTVDEYKACLYKVGCTLHFARLVDAINNHIFGGNDA